MYINPANFYELSIYDAVPTQIWLLLILCSVCGFILSYVSIFSTDRKPVLFGIGLLSLILGRFVLLNIPFFRGYYCWKGDTITHIAMSLDILNDGTWWRNAYPFTHIFSDSVIMVTGLPILPTINYIPSFFSIFFVISIYLLSKSIFNNNKVVMLCTICSAAVLLGGKINTLFYAFGIGYIYLIFFIYLLIKSGGTKNRIKFGALLILVTLACPMIHPFVSLIFCGFIIVYLILPFISRSLHIAPIDQNIITKQYSNKRPILLIIQILVLFYWITFGVRNIFDQNIRYVSSMIQTLSLDNPEGVKLASSVEKLSLSYLDTIWLVVKTAGADIIFCSTILVTSLILLRKYWLTRDGIYGQGNSHVDKYVLYILVLEICLTGFYVGSLIGIIPGAGALNSQRLLLLIPLLSPILVGYAIFEYLKSRNSNTISHSIISCVIVFSIILGVIGVFQSPIIMRANVQTEEKDINEISWFLDHKSPSFTEITIISDPWRLGGPVYGYRELRTRSDINQGYETPIFADHFNYAGTQYIGQNYVADKYGIFLMADKIIYEQLWSALNRFNSSDFSRMNIDPSVDKLYQNGEGDIWYIHAGYHIT